MIIRANVTVVKKTAISKVHMGKIRMKGDTEMSRIRTLTIKLLRAKWGPSLLSIFIGVVIYIPLVVFVVLPWVDKTAPRGVGFLIAFLLLPIGLPVIPAIVTIAAKATSNSHL